MFHGHGRERGCGDSVYRLLFFAFIAVFEDGPDMIVIQHLGSAPRGLLNSQDRTAGALSPSPVFLKSRKAVTLTLPCRQCSRSLPQGSSVKRAKPEWDDFLMPVSWFSRWRNSSTVEEPSKPTTCRREASSLRANFPGAYEGSRGGLHSTGGKKQGELGS